ncbi:MAG: hypothetical protein A2W91_12770 [Bacteroidetes bacterium GWF2_38_335]|nr:MAG: hypothetical protein A2W91_12770 [Bacteroidetes bacterium GWF2_38_335]HBS86898.1 hypothetical protein [Bacteroidales bacterium]
MAKFYKLCSNLRSNNIELSRIGVLRKRNSKTLSQIASEYGIHINILRRWIKPIKNDLKLNNRKLLLPWQVEIINNFLDSR